MEEYNLMSFKSGPFNRKRNRSIDYNTFNQYLIYASLYRI